MDFNKNVWFVGFVVFAIVSFVAVIPGVHWYRSSVQAEVYHRAGIEITTWEVFVGAKPPDRIIHVK